MIVIQCADAAGARLQKAGYQPSGGLFMKRCAEEWAKEWTKAEELLAGAQEATAAIFNEEQAPPPTEMASHLKPISQIREMADSLWLGEALLANRVLCYLQPIVDAQGTVFGHEAFARALRADGTLMSGYDIIAASRHLNIEYRLDRLLHQKAIESFVDAGQQGHLFINFLPGFIHRPEVYLNGLGDVLKECGVSPERIVLDLTQSELQKDIDHLQAIAVYCRAQGYAIALDDIRLTDHSEKLLHDIRPNYVKLDQKLGKSLLESRGAKLVVMAHMLHIKVIGEGVESEEILSAMKICGVDYFQGYHIGLPVAVTSIPRQVKA